MKDKTIDRIIDRQNMDKYGQKDTVDGWTNEHKDRQVDRQIRLIVG